MSSPFSAVKGLVVGRWLLAVVTVVVCVLGGLVLVGGSVATTNGDGTDRVTGIVTQHGSVRVHNFEVADLHTYTITNSGHYSHNCLAGYGDAAKTAVDVPSASNKIYSSRVLQRMADEPGPYHNFPSTFDNTIFSQGNRTVVPNCFNKAKPNLGNDSIQYRLPGSLNGRAGTYEVFTRPSASGQTEMVMHRVFRPEH